MKAFWFTVLVLERYVDRVAFQLTTCDEGLLTFAFRVADGVVRASQNYEHEPGEALGIQIGASVKELTNEE